MLLPLFPLSTVLFPGCTLDLQIFEPRYLDMISRCLKAGEGFGVVRLLRGREVGEAATTFAGIGCEALIRDWHQQPNGLLGIRVQGGRRFIVRSSSAQPDQLLIGEVDWLAEPANPPLTDEHADLLALFEALAEHPLVAALEMGGAASGMRDLADRLAYLLPFALEQKLALLEADDPQQRLAMIQVYLERLQDEGA